MRLLFVSLPSKMDQSLPRFQTPWLRPSETNRTITFRAPWSTRDGSETILLSPVQRKLRPPVGTFPRQREDREVRATPARKDNSAAIYPLISSPYNHSIASI